MNPNSLNPYYHEGNKTNEGTDEDINQLTENDVSTKKFKKPNPTMN